MSKIEIYLQKSQESPSQDMQIAPTTTFSIPYLWNVVND